MLVYLFGGYTRPGYWSKGVPMSPRFLTYRRALRHNIVYRHHDENYALRHMAGPVIFVPGRLARRKPKEN